MQLLLKKFTTTLLVAFIALGLFFTASYAFAQNDTAQSSSPLATQSPSIPDVPSQNQKVVLESLPDNSSAWKSDELSTAGLKFMIRGKEALAWSLNIDQSGFDNPAIKHSYSKVLTIVNSLLVIGLLLIAGMWMFSLVIPRQTLKKVIFYYVVVAIFVNFAFPLNRLFIDSTNLLQRTFLVQNGKQIAIADIIETPVYNDKNTIGYVNTTSDETSLTSRTLTIGTNNANTTNTTASTARINGTLQTGDNTSENVNLLISTDQSVPLTIESKSGFSPNFENSLFASFMMILTGIAYFAIALIFVSRIVILWALMILSPVLFIMAVFQFTRGYFYNWLGIYSKWLLIGPLTALGIAIVVGIWKTVGLPISSLYETANSFGVISNIGFMLPGSTAVNHLSNASEMMEYVVFLLMLYLPIVFSFALTRHKTLANIASTVVVRTRESFGHISSIKSAIKKETHNMIVNAHGVKESKIAKFTKNILPNRLKEPSAVPSSLETASTFLPKQLAVSSISDMLTASMNLIGIKEGSRSSRERVIKSLAVPEQVKGIAEREKLIAVRSEINKRADQGNAEAILIRSEVQQFAPASIHTNFNQIT